GVAVAAFDVSVWGVGILVDVIVFATVESVDCWPEGEQPAEIARTTSSEMYVIRCFDFIAERPF
ncbi:MAG: hypothetical protein VCB82_05415, partial [Alphaproteobacteria bacterium]